ncbi:MAG: 3-hydroxyacyl-CoA dehydrogenase NAD-binding domain-containing protein [Desulfomonilaceae bacterium]
MPEVTYMLDKASKIATFVVNTAGPVNTIGRAFIADLERATARARLEEVSGVIIISAKKRSFLDGANLKEIITDATPAGIRHEIQRYQEALAALAKSHFPVAALVDGQTALGGGFELLLWGCDHVFTTASSKMGLPEVNVGLFPAGGGTQTLRKVISFKDAVDAITTGRVNSAADYAKSGFVTICPASELESEAMQWIEDHQGIINRNYDPNFQETDPSSEDEKLKILASARTRHGITPYRPYILAALDSMEAGLKMALDDAVRHDLDLFVPLFDNPNSRNKIDLFFLVSSLGPRLAKVDTRHALNVNKLAIIGSGLMGSGIAQVAADNGIKTSLIDMDEETACRAVERIDRALQDLVAKGRWSQRRKDALIANLSWTTDYSELKEMPLVIECVFEDLPLKQNILAKVQEVNPDVIFASNTSTIPMAEISKGARRPEQVVGMHYFSPVPLMPLLEVIQGPQSSSVAVATAVTAGRAMGKTVILVGDGPGFYTSRTFGVYVLNGFRLAELGMSPWEVDMTALRAGFPQGPLHIYGTAGGKVVYHASQFLASQFPSRIHIPTSLVKMYEAGYVGAGKPSFYLDDRKMVPDPSAAEFIARAKGLPKPTPEEAQDILLLGMVNEAFWCMSDGVLRDYFSMDLGAVLGIGFPDCWHGPARYVSLKGVKAVHQRLTELADKFQLASLVPAPEFDQLIACGLNSNLV